jgi:hypothetical protein
VTSLPPLGPVMRRWLRSLVTSGSPSRACPDGWSSPTGRTASATAPVGGAPTARQLIRRPRRPSHWRPRHDLRVGACSMRRWRCSPIPVAAHQRWNADDLGAPASCDVMGCGRGERWGRRGQPADVSVRRKFAAATCPLPTRTMPTGVGWVHLCAAGRRICPSRVLTAKSREAGKPRVSVLSSGYDA